MSFNITDAMLDDIASTLEGKAECVRSGFYDPEDEPGDNLEWEADLLSAAARIRSRRFTALKDIHFEEIECCGFEGSELLEEIRRLSEVEEED